LRKPAGLRENQLDLGKTSWILRKSAGLRENQLVLRKSDGKGVNQLDLGGKKLDLGKTS
jgi:hypothetical protein